MKKIMALIMAMVMLFSFTGCGKLWLLFKIADTMAPGIVESDVDKEPGLMPYADLPEYSEDFKMVLSCIDIDEKRLEKFMGYCKAAYYEYDAKQFCEYFVSESDRDIIGVLSDALEIAADKYTDYSTEEKFRRSFAVQEMNFDLSVINYGVATYVLAYFDIDENEDVSAYESLKESYADFINQFAELVYGTEIL